MLYCDDSLITNDQSINIKLVEQVEKQEHLYNYNLGGCSRKDPTEIARQLLCHYKLPGFHIFLRVHLLFAFYGIDSSQSYLYIW